MPIYWRFFLIYNLKSDGACSYCLISRRPRCINKCSLQEYVTLRNFLIHEEVKQLLKMHFKRVFFSINPDRQKYTKYSNTIHLMMCILILGLYNNQGPTGDLHVT